MRDDRVILSERPEDLRKAVEWGREQQKKCKEAGYPASFFILCTGNS